MSNCRSCSSEHLKLIIDLGEQPWCNNFLKKEELGTEKKYPLRLMYCNSCELLQLNHTVNKEIMFGDHFYLSGMTSTLKKHFFDIAEENIKQFNISKDDLVIEIGGNDGTQLIQYKNLGIENLLNVECAKTVSEISRNNGIKTDTEYFNKNYVLNRLTKNSVKLYNASGVFFHLEELHSVIDGIKYSLREDGVLIVQFMYAGSMVENLNFDTIYHEHLCYYTLKSLQNLLNFYDLKIFDAYYSDIHSGSIIAKITHKDGILDIKTDRYLKTIKNDQKYDLESFVTFANKVEQTRNELKNILVELKKQGKKIYAYGAPAKGNTLLNYFNIDHNLIDKAVEINNLKIGHFLPQSHIPIEKESEGDLPDYYLLLSHNFVDEILSKNKNLRENGVKFIIPFPEVKIV
jgi:hypothetical protein